MTHSILHGDVVEQLKDLPDNSIDLIATDPPYNLGMDDWDKWSSNRAFSEWCEEWGTEAYRVLKPGGTIFAFSSGRTYHHLAIALDSSGFLCRDMIEWVYWGTMPRGKNLKSCHEPIFVGSKETNTPFNVDANRISFSNKVKKEFDHLLLPQMPTGKHPGRKAYSGTGDAKKFNTALDNKPYAMNEAGRHPFNVITTNITDVAYPTNVLDIKKPRGAESIKGHQTQKPISVMSWLISLASNPGDVVLDCFGGTGTTMVAGEQTGRSTITIEREQEYVDIMKQRAIDNGFVVEVL